MSYVTSFTELRVPLRAPIDIPRFE